MKITTIRPLPLDDYLPAMTYRDLATALQRVAAHDQHRIMVPYLVSALRTQAPFLSGDLVMFEILRASNCLADVPTPMSDG